VGCLKTEESETEKLRSRGLGVMYRLHSPGLNRAEEFVWHTRGVPWNRSTGSVQDDLPSDLRQFRSPATRGARNWNTHVLFPLRSHIHTSSSIRTRSVLSHSSTVQVQTATLHRNTPLTEQAPYIWHGCHPVSFSSCVKNTRTLFPLLGTTNSFGSPWKLHTRLKLCTLTTNR
jgi:hypothetical protein